MTQTIPQLQPASLKQSISEWQIIHPLLYAQRLNRLLRTREIQREFHRCALAYSAIRRWECVERTDFNYYPKPPRLEEGQEFLTMEQMDSCEWRWCRGPGRPPVYMTQTCHGSCHWRAAGDLAVARRLLSDFEWMVVSGKGHTAVMAPAEQLIWDPTYFALGVSAQAALEHVFGDDLSSNEYTIYLEEYAFSRHTIELMHLFGLLDERPEEDRLRLIRDFPEVMRRDLVAA